MRERVENFIYFVFCLAFAVIFAAIVLFMVVTVAQEAPPVDPPGSNVPCAINLTADARGVRYWWLAGYDNALRDGGYYISREPGPVGCVEFGIKPEDLAAARWLTVAIYTADMGDTFELKRIEPNGHVKGMDINGDGVLNLLDVAIVRSMWLWDCDRYSYVWRQPTYLCSADFNADGTVNFLDLARLTSYYLEQW